MALHPENQSETKNHFAEAGKAVVLAVVKYALLTSLSKN